MGYQSGSHNFDLLVLGSCPCYFWFEFRFGCQLYKIYVWDKNPPFIKFCTLVLWGAILRSDFEERFWGAILMCDFEEWFWVTILRNAFEERFWGTIFRNVFEERFWGGILMRDFEEWFWGTILRSDFEERFWGAILRSGFEERFWVSEIQIGSKFCSAHINEGVSHRSPKKECLRHVNKTY